MVHVFDGKSSHGRPILAKEYYVATLKGALAVVTGSASDIYRAAVAPFLFLEHGFVSPTKSAPTFGSAQAKETCPR